MQYMLGGGGGGGGVSWSNNPPNHHPPQREKEKTSSGLAESEREFTIPPRNLCQDFDPRPQKVATFLEFSSGFGLRMCPLRVILIFLSATIAGFFLIRGLKADPNFDDNEDDAAAAVGEDKGSPRAPVPLHSKVGSAIKTGFWTMVDMASGRYLWRTLVAPPEISESSKAQ